MSLVSSKSHSNTILWLMLVTSSLVFGITYGETGIIRLAGAAVASLGFGLAVGLFPFPTFIRLLALAPTIVLLLLRLKTAGGLGDLALGFLVLGAILGKDIRSRIPLLLESFTWLSTLMFLPLALSFLLSGGPGEFEPYFQGYGMSASLGSIGLAFLLTLSRPDTHLSGLLLSSDRAGRLARILLPGAVLMPLSVAWVARQTLMIDLTGNEIPLVGIVWLDVVGSLFILLISLRTMQLTDLERLEARSEEDRFRALTEASFEGIAILRSAKIYDLNPTFSRMFGYQPEELRGVEFQELLAPESRRRWANRPSLTGQASEALEQRAMTRGGRRFDVEVRTHQVLYQEVLSEVVVLRDVTDRKEYERELFKTQAEAIRAMHAKSSFLAQMSHEIRTPLHGVIGITEILKETPLSEDQKGLVATLEDSGRALLQIVDDVLDFSRMESNQVSIEMREFLLASLLQGVLGQMTALASAKGIGLDSEVSDSLSGANLSLRGDEHRIRQVLLNLISNAIKFTEAGKITIRVSEATNDGVRFEVVDSGMGIEESMLEQIFQPFVQADSSISRRFGGSGLGLTISKNLVELMGGTMGVVSQLGVGSTFWFQLHLPRGIRSTAITQDFTRSITRDLQKVLSVWVVEDHPTNQMIVVRMLESAGLLARVFQSGKELIERMVNDSEFRGALPHVILMDVQMPDMDGYVTTQRIREFGEKWQSVPILAMTAHALEGDREKCLQAGMDDYLSKPLQKEELIQRVRHWAEMGRVT